MGMFDYIEITIPCHHCGKEISSWQTKSYLCGLEKIQLWEIPNGTFYSGCSGCGTWNEHQVTVSHATEVNDIPVLLDGKVIAMVPNLHAVAVNLAQMGPRGG